MSPGPAFQGLVGVAADDSAASELDYDQEVGLVVDVLVEVGFEVVVVSENEFQGLDFAWGVDSVRVALNLVEEELLLGQSEQVMRDEEVSAFGGGALGEEGGVGE